jgi:hypothetical protein
MMSKGHLNAFTTILAFKKQFGRNRESNVLSRLKALKTPNLPTRRLKNDFGKVDEAVFQGVKRQCELIFCILDIKNSTWTKLLK